MKLVMFIHLTIVGCQIHTDAIGDVYSLDHSGMSNSN